MRRLYAKTAKDVTKSRNRVNEQRKQENENGLTKQGIGNEVTDAPITAKNLLLCTVTFTKTRLLLFALNLAILASPEANTAGFCCLKVLLS